MQTNPHTCISTYSISAPMGKQSSWQSQQWTTVFTWTWDSKLYPRWASFNKQM